MPLFYRRLPRTTITPNGIPVAERHPPSLRSPSACTTTCSRPASVYALRTSTPHAAPHATPPRPRDTGASGQHAEPRIAAIGSTPLPRGANLPIPIADAEVPPPEPTSQFTSPPQARAPDGTTRPPLPRTRPPLAFTPWFGHAYRVAARRAPTRPGFDHAYISLPRGSGIERPSSCAVSIHSRITTSTLAKASW